MTDQPKFTPGPWEVDKQTGSVWTDDARYLQIAHCQSQPGGGMQHDFGVVQANAHLIAAAPDMYEALKVAREAIASLPEDALGTGFATGYDEPYPYPIRDELLNTISAALRKAEGGSHE